MTKFKNNFDPTVVDPRVNSGPGGVWRSMKAEQTNMEGKSFVAWAAWLHDNNVYFSNKDSWAKVPKVGMQMLMLYYENGKRAVFKNHDEYVLKGEKESKLGLMIPFEEYEAIIDLAHCVYYDLETEKFYTKE